QDLLAADGVAHRGVQGLQIGTTCRTYLDHLAGISQLQTDIDACRLVHLNGHRRHYRFREPNGRDRDGVNSRRYLWKDVLTFTAGCGGALGPGAGVAQLDVCARDPRTRGIDDLP